MKLSRAALLLTFSLFLNACGKSKPPEPAAANATPPVAESAPSQAKPQSKACDLITVEEMSQLLGATVVPTADEGVGRTSCNWAPAGGGMPFAELKVEWGMGDAAMQAASMLSKREPGINDPYDDLGDEAWVTGPAVMIKKGDDLVTIMIYGAQDAAAAVHKIYESAVSRL